MYVCLWSLLLCLVVGRVSMDVSASVFCSRLSTCVPPQLCWRYRGSPSFADPMKATMALAFSGYLSDFLGFAISRLSAR